MGREVRFGRVFGAADGVGTEKGCKPTCSRAVNTLGAGVIVILGSLQEQIFKGSGTKTSNAKIVGSFAFFLQFRVVTMSKKKRFNVLEGR